MNIFIYVCLYAHMHFFLNLLNTSCMVFYSYTSTCIFSTNQNTVLHTNIFKIDFYNGKIWTEKSPILRMDV